MDNVFEKMSLKGKAALVTGGYRGIGAGLAEAMAQAGADVATCARTAHAGDGFMEELAGKYGVRTMYLQGDMAVMEDCERIADTVEKEFGKIDVLCNNAGVAINVPAEDMTWDEWYYVININLNSVFRMCQAVGRKMIAAGNGGSIINTGSISGFIVNVPQPQCSYNAAKAGVHLLTKSLAVEWQKYGIRVNAICPGYIDTPLLAPGLASPNGKIWLDMTPVGRLGQPYELGGLAIWLASEAGGFATGGCYIVDGGYTLI